MENVKPLSGWKWECQGMRNGYGMGEIPAIYYGNLEPKIQLMNIHLLGDKMRQSLSNENSH
jgi:hypothetical protein